MTFTTSDPIASPDQRSRQPVQRKEQAVEVGVFLLLIVPSMVLSLLVIRQGNLSFPLVAATVILRNVALVCLVLFFLWRNGEPLAAIGWRRARLWREMAWGVALFVPFVFGTNLVQAGFRAVGLQSPAQRPAFLTPSGGAEVLVAVVLVAVVAIAEETIFRGYLLLRFTALAGNTAGAVLLSSAIFSIGHGYEGTLGLATVGMMGLALALVYLWRRSLTASIVLHFLQDFMGIVVVPLLGSRVSRRSVSRR